MGRTGTRLFAVALGLVAGLIVLVAFASRLGMVGSPPGPTAATVRDPTPTSVSGAKRLTSIASLAGGSGLSVGDLVELRLDETSLNHDVTDYLRQSVQGVTVGNTRVQLQSGEVILTGSLRQGVLATEFTMTSYPAIQSGRVMLVIESIEPGLVAQFSPVKAGESIELAPNLEARSAKVVTGLMVVVGVVR